MDINRLRAAATAVFGFFGFLLAFLYVASALGGGAEGLGLSALVGVIVASVTYMLYPSSTGTRMQTQPKPVTKPSSVTSVEYERVCDPGPYDVQAGSPVKIELNIKQGDSLAGEVTEKDNYKFNCYLVDPANFVRLVNREWGFRPIFKSEAKGAHHVNIRVPSNAQWYAVLDAYGAQYVREVTVNLKRPKRGLGIT